MSSLKDILTGEKGPYRLVPLLVTQSDSTRLRTLSAFASPKHERLMHLIEKQEYDAVEIIVDQADTSRAKVAEMAAKVALEDSTAGQIVPCDAKNLEAILDILGDRHEEWYVRDGFNFEIGLTGDKISGRHSR